MNSDALLDAIRNGDTEIVRACVNNRLPSEKEWKGGYKFLKEALGYEQLIIARILLNKVTLVNNPTDQLQLTPLHYAVQSNDTEIMKILLQKGADMNAVDSSDMTPLHYSVRVDNLEIVKLLLEHGADPNSHVDFQFHFTPLQHACYSPKVEILEAFLDQGCDVNCTFEHLDNFICPRGSTPLHLAIIQKNLESVRMLLSRGASANHANQHGETCLHVACRENSLEIVQLLMMEKNIKVNCKTNENVTPLHIAVRNGNIDIVKLLLANGANTGCKDKNDKVPLQIAVELRYIKTVDYLLEQNHDVTNVDNRTSFKTALLEYGLGSDIFKCYINNGFSLSTEDIVEVTSEAIHKGYFHIVETLLNYTSTPLDVNFLLEARNDKGDTLLHLATKNHQHDIVRLLVSKKADVQAINNEGNTAIFYAIENNDEYIVKTLITEGGACNYSLLLHTAIQLKKHKSKRLLELILQSGVDVNQRDEELEGLTALHLICRESMKSDVELAELLLHNGANVDAVTDHKLTVSHMAAARSDGEAIVKTILNYDPDIDARDLSGMTPLHMAAANANCKIISILLEHGASVNMADNLGMTPIDVAVSVKNSVPTRRPDQPIDEAAEFLEKQSKEAVDTLLQHLVKLDVAKLRIHESNKKYLTDDLNEYRVKCELELDDIKKFDLNSYATLYDVIAGNVKKIARYTREQNAKTDLESVEYKNSYPIYGVLIDALKKKVMREYILNKAKNAIIFLTDHGLPDTCSENIFIYLRTQDLVNFTIALSIIIKTT